MFRRERRVLLASDATTYLTSALDLHLHEQFGVLPFGLSQSLQLTFAPSPLFSYLHIIEV